MKNYKFYLDGKEIECNDAPIKLEIDYTVNENDIYELEFINNTAEDIINWVNSSKETKRKTITMIKDYYKQIGIDRMSRLNALHGIILEQQLQMLFDTEDDGYKARYTFKFKALEGLLGLISWNIDVTRFLYIELMGFKE